VKANITRFTLVVAITSAFVLIARRRPWSADEEKT